MTQLEPSDLSPVKRARAEITSKSDAFASIDVSKRAKELSRKISSLCEEFPEMKYILDSEKLQEVAIETAVQKYKDETMKDMEKGEVKKRKVMINSKESVPLYSLPDELFQNCLSYVGIGHYALVGLASKSLNEAYAKHFGRETSFLEMATSVKIANFCLSDLCESMKQKDEILKAAAVNGNIDILRNAVKFGYDLFPLIEMKKFEVHDVHNDTYMERSAIDWDVPEYELEDCALDIYIANKNEENTVKLSKLVERGHLHVLKYLYEELNYRKGLQRYIKPAIQYGQLEILKWLQSIDLLDEDDELNRVHDNGDADEYKSFYFCDFAVRSGNVEVLKWLLDQDFDFYLDSSIMDYAVCSNSFEMIRFCSEKGYDVNAYKENYYGTMRRKSVELYRLLHEVGHEFGGRMKKWIGYSNDIAENFEIIKFLHSISIPWDDEIMKDIVAKGTLEMMKYAHENGCPWTAHGDEYKVLLESDKGWSLDKFKYLMNNGCKFDFKYSSSWFISKLVKLLRKQKELVLLDFFVGKDSNFDRNLLEEITQGNFWTEGISYMLENNNTAKNLKSIEELFNKLSYRMDFLKYFHSQGLPWCLDPSGKTHLLSRIACFNNLDDVKWAYENGCKGGGSFPYVEEEWKHRGIRERDEWKANCHFFEENDMLPMMELPKWSRSNRFIHLTSDLVAIDNLQLKSLVDEGFTFDSEKEKEDHVSQALEMCFEHSYGGHGENINNRKRLCLFRQMRVA
ncbi:hypothetical protein CTEN210_12001 [Chaetoceros tenuissimus]|uniref:F-box domain-containing protein n=1 Tax=Chaetoceros tenuissimus TaxID=426638 RepID=A0AAD3D2U3_9STRA|nr:hypothetical protein CTEN210_12001 [Chaetoceros tenuissimus]